MTREGTWVDRWVREHYAALMIQDTVGLTIESDPVRVRVVTSALGFSYYELPDGRRFPVPVDPREPMATWDYSDYPEDRRAEQMAVNVRHVTVPVADFVQQAIDAVGTEETAGDIARQVIARHLGEEAVEGLEDEDISVRVEYQNGGVVRVYETPDGESVTEPIYGVGFGSPSIVPMEEGAMAELERFEWTIRNLDPALSAWNPLTGSEPVLCRVCGRTSDPRSGKVLEHLDRYPCTPMVGEASTEGGTNQVLDTVLLKSFSLREEMAAERDELTPDEILALSVRAYQDSGMKWTSLPQGPVRECHSCMALSPAPGWAVHHTWHQCADTEDYVVTELDPATVTVAAAHLPGARSLVDPEWHHLDSGWWVAPEGTEGPAWAETYHGSMALPAVAKLAITPSPRTPVRLSEADREQSRSTANTLTRMAAYFRRLDRPEILHGITALTQAMATAVDQSWRALEAMHAEDEGSLLHASLGVTEECVVCEYRPGATPTDWRRGSLATHLHARQADLPGRRLRLRTVRLILDELIRLEGEGISLHDVYSLSRLAMERVNRVILFDSDPRNRGLAEVSISDVAQVIRVYTEYRADGGTL